MNARRDGRPEGGARDEGPASRRRGERLIGLLVGGALALNFPLLAIFSGSRSVAGIPALYLYLFVVWALIVGATALVLRRPPPPPGADDGPEP